MPRSLGTRLAASLLGVMTLNTRAAVVDEKEIHAQLNPRVPVVRPHPRISVAAHVLGALAVRVAEETPKK
jgi:hypothetical protein